MPKLLQKLMVDETGQDLAEYSLLLVYVMSAMLSLASSFHAGIAVVTSVSQEQLGAAQAVIR